MSSDDIIISHPAGTRTLALRESYLAICGGDKCEAHLLNSNERWYAFKLRNRQQARSVNRTAEANGEEASADEGLWVFMSSQEWAADLLNQYDEKTIRNKLARLVERRFLSRRSNPRKKWDRKPQWLFMRANVQAAVDTWASQVRPDMEPAAGGPDENADQVNSGNDTTPIREKTRMQPGDVPDGHGTTSDSNRANARSNTTGISHRDFHQESFPGGESGLESDARATRDWNGPVVEPSSAPFTTRGTSGETAGGQPYDTGLAGPPDGGTADAAVTEADLASLFGDQVMAPPESETLTDVQESPGGQAGREDPATPGDAHDPEATRAVLRPALGGQTKLNALMQETPPCLQGGARHGWITQITPERAAELIALSRADTTAHPWTSLIERLDQEVGARISRAQRARNEATGTQPGTYLTAQERAARAAIMPAVTSGEIWYSRSTGKAYLIEDVTSQSVFVAGAGEYPLLKFHGIFRS